MCFLAKGVAYTQRTRVYIFPHCRNARANSVIASYLIIIRFGLVGWMARANTYTHAYAHAGTDSLTSTSI